MLRALLIRLEDLPASVAVPLLAAFLLQLSFYLLPGFPALRQRVQRRFSPLRIAAFTILAAALPYLAYSVPTGVFRLSALAKLAGLAAIPVLVFAVFPTRAPGLAWQDLIAGGTVAATQLGKVFRQIYESPHPAVRAEWTEWIGRIMIVTVGTIAFLLLRRLEGTGYRWRISAADVKTALRQLLWFLVVGIPIGLAIGFAGYKPVQLDAAWMYPPLVLLTFLIFWAGPAMFEEFYFRGVLQNLAGTTLRHPVAAQTVASVAFGLVHLPFRDFPNWRFALLAAIAGWFYGQAYRERGTVVASALTHAAVFTIWRLVFSG